VAGKKQELVWFTAIPPTPSIIKKEWNKNLKLNYCSRSFFKPSHLFSAHPSTRTTLNEALANTMLDYNFPETWNSILLSAVL